METKKRRHGMRSLWRLAGLLLVLEAALVVRAEPPSFTLPGRKPDSTEPPSGFHGQVYRPVDCR